MKFITSINEGFKIALHALKTNKLRAFLTTLCIIIGITMVTIVDTVTTGMDNTFDESMAMLGQNVVYVEKWPWDGGDDRWWEIMNRPEMEMEYVEFIAERSRYAETVAISANNNATIRYKDKSAERVGLQGATHNYLDIQGLDIERGRMYTESESRSRSNVAVIGGSLVSALFENEEALGKTIRFGGQKFLVIGILKKQGSFLGLGDQDNRIIIPISSYEKMYGLNRGLQMGIKFPDEATKQEGIYEIEGLMRQVRGLDATEENDFALNEPDTFKEQLAGIKNGIYFGGFVLVGLSLLIGGIGIMNIMFVSVKERTKEIGIRKAVGAKSWEILAQFLIEAIVLSLIGGVIGVIIAGGFTFIIDQVFTAQMNIQVVLLAVALCTFVGVIFGFIPAYKAAKSDPIESLRFE